jgi:hypothetical protein
MTEAQELVAKAFQSTAADLASHKLAIDRLQENQQSPAPKIAGVCPALESLMPPIFPNPLPSRGFLLKL